MHNHFLMLTLICELNRGEFQVTGRCVACSVHKVLFSSSRHLTLWSPSDKCASVNLVLVSFIKPQGWEIPGDANFQLLK